MPRSRQITGLVVVGALIGCNCAGPTVPLDITTLDPAQDQWKVAAAYSHQAIAMRKKAEDLAHLATRYARLFGPDSDWATSARLLAQFYEDSAQERDRQAEIHAGVGSGQPPSVFPRPGSR